MKAHKQPTTHKYSEYFFSFFHKIKILIKKFLFNKKLDSLENTINEALEEYQNISGEKIGKEEQLIIQNSLHIGDKIVEDIMIPRPDICAIDVNITFDELISTFARSNHSRLPVYQESLDNIIGFINIKDIMEIIADKKEFNINKILRKHLTVPGSMKVIDLLIEMKQKYTHIAVVIDEYGGTDGMSTIEDVIEEIVGDLDDEYEDNKQSEYYKIIDENTILANARIEIEELEELLDIKLKPKGEDFDTLGGLILSKVAHIPSKGTIINIHPKLDAEIMEANPRSIKQVKLLLIK